MNKNDLVAAIAEDTAKSKVDVTAVLASLAGVTSKALKSGGARNSQRYRKALLS